MYVPPLYQEQTEAWMRTILEQYPLATFVSNGSAVPYATHLPVIPAPETAPTGPLEGSVMLCHMNRSNPHWAALEDGTQGRLIFAGPHSYITPVDYQVTPASPTWDFVAVHLAGRVEPLDGLEATLEVVTRTAELFEARFGAGWDASSSLDYFRSIGSGVGAFRFHVTSADSMFKLSQEKSEDIRARVIERLATARRGAARDLADLMSQYALTSAPVRAAGERPADSGVA